MDVNNVLAQLSLVEADAEMDVSDIVEEHNPDCYVLVYAVDDIESFGEFLQASFHVFSFLIFFRMYEEQPILAVREQLPGREVSYPGGQQGGPGEDQGGGHGGGV